MMRRQRQFTRKDKCTVKCQTHGDKNVKYYCPTHGQLSCSVCLNLGHRACKTCKDIIYIPDIADNLENNAEYKQADGHLSSVLERFKKAKETAEQNSKSLDSGYKGALETIRIFKKEINEAIDIIEREILKKASEMKTAEMGRIIRVDEVRAQAEKELKDTLAKQGTFRKLKQNCNLFTEMMTIKTKFTALSDELETIEREQSKTEIKFTPNAETLDFLRQADALGKLTITRKHEQKMDVSSPLLDTSNIIKADHSHDINVKCGDDKQDCWITGSAILPDSRLLIADHINTKLKAIDIQHSQVSSELTLSSNPWDIAVINNNKVAVTLPKVKQVDFVTTTGKLSVERSLHLREHCHGIDYMDNKLAITFADSNKIKVIDLQGTVLHSIQPTKQGRSLFNYPRYTCFGPDNTTLYVTCSGSHEVLFTTLDGCILSSYTDKDLKHPKTVVLGKCGNVYVCSSGSSTIHQITPDCKKIRVLLDKEIGLRWPYTVSLSKSENKLYVGMERCNIVTVYKTIVGRN